MNFKIELCVDRVAYVSAVGKEVLRCFVDEDLHYPCEPERRRAATAAEMVEIRSLWDAGLFSKIEALPPMPTL